MLLPGLTFQKRWFSEQALTATSPTVALSGQMTGIWQGTHQDLRDDLWPD